MKKIITTILSFSLLGGVAAVFGGAGAPATAAFAEDNQLAVNCKSAYLCDYNSGECIYKLNETKRMPIASVCKVMTLTLCFDAIAEGKLSLTDNITISERAAGMGGSQVFLQAGLTYPLTELIKSIVVCSANDSCVAVSESISGSEESFVAAMNRRAEELGCDNTLFANCTGLPKETQYSCAKDVAVMFSNLLQNEEYFKYSKIWLEDFSHPDDRTTTITNTNKLIKKYSACDGGKTGFTNQAGFCLASTAKRDSMRLVSVVLGADNSDNRFKSAINMFNYGFANYKNAVVLDKDVNLNDKFFVDCSKKTAICVRPARSCYVFTANNVTPEIERKVVAYDIKAPVKKGDAVGKIEVYKDGILYDTVDLVAAEDADKASYGDFFKKVAGEWTL
ncbi:MAG: D-alanyl-D-alanine carboxypeptidase [Clostridiales bacterium]|nr:D-alanyl-D-alanine carboxypeptidase [Clostridiales bacterium]